MTDQELDELLMACLTIVFPGRQIDHLTDEEIDEWVAFAHVLKLRNLAARYVT